MKKDLISILDFNAKEVSEVFAMAKTLKKKPFSRKDALKDNVVGLIFEKPSNRTRVSFDVGVKQLGGDTIYLGHADIRFGERESVKDIARVLSRYVQMVILRTFRHTDIVEYAEYSSIPVINGLSDVAHPCQGLSDVFTMQEKLGKLKGRTMAYIGDSNNVLHSLLYSCAMAAMNVKIATPKQYGPDKKIVRSAMEIAKKAGASIEVCNDAFEAARSADVLYTDVWVSMGQEDEKKQRLGAFKRFQINNDVLKAAGKDVLVMHCLPAHRGEEITDDVIESPNSIVFDQAENRLHVQKAIMIKLIESCK